MPPTFDGARAQVTLTAERTPDGGITQLRAWCSRRLRAFQQWSQGRNQALFPSRSVPQCHGESKTVPDTPCYRAEGGANFEKILSMTEPSASTAGPAMLVLHLETPTIAPLALISVAHSNPSCSRPCTRSYTWLQAPPIGPLALAHALACRTQSTPITHVHLLAHLHLLMHLLARQCTFVGADHRTLTAIMSTAARRG